MIEVRELTKEYADLKRGTFRALRGISFEAREGEIFALLGPNGAGKTTALRILSTILSPTSGTVRINGLDVVASPAEVRRQIGFVSVNTAVYDRMTAWEMVDFFGRLHDLAAETLRERMEALFDSLQMNDFRDVLGAKLSTGMKQKVSIARALVHDPPALIFDEATSGLDVLAARSLIDIIRGIGASGKCVVFSSHVMREVERVADRVAIMHRGAILAEGTRTELIDRYGQPDLEELFFDLISHQDRGVEDERAGNAEKTGDYKRADGPQEVA